MFGIVVKIRPFFIIIYSLILAVIFITGFSTSTSPLYSLLGSDSAIFRLIGLAIKSGKSLYVDIFDHKGPMLFFIEYLGQIISSDRIGIWLVQIIFLAGTLFFIYKLSRIFLKKNIAWIIPPIFLYFLAFFFEGGNYSEEYSLFFCFLAIYLLIKEMTKPNVNFSKLKLFIVGASLATIIFIRANNAAPILAITAIYMLSILYVKDYKRLLSETLLLLAGFLSITSIIIIFFYLNHSLYDMIYATFLFNLKYSEFRFHDMYALVDKGYLQWALINTSICVVGGLAYYFENKSKKILIASIILACSSLFVVLQSTNGYFHYLQLSLPAFILGLILTVSVFIKSERRAILKTLQIIGAIFISGVILLSFYKIDRRAQYYDTSYINWANQLVDIIPKNERSLVFGYNVPAKFFFITKVIPDYKYFTLQDWWCSHDSKICEELETYFKTTPPKWLFVYNGAINDKIIDNIIKNEYTLVQPGPDLIMYKRINSVK